MPESIAAHGEQQDLPGEQRQGDNSGIESPDLGILSESSDEGVTDSGCILMLLCVLCGKSF
jgi:hypothetical protein